ncbi:Threonine/homoserine/homoserine lactone efflux protein [Chitinophaga terrae (ex Kim and Jung 2007)]|jgi:threonine/homoserine/homoserine lactone efflux protein|uniref:Threonine/homoserine/homoserine lactone efflux protein n=1 Tax=Chitinophaga terrae (ex Kim and Jung 2007) TaxID=408074 RepID=A0A1H3XTX9_9BACT|nr:LysE family transporter [Chitinophaga terrae (ex Kim and Jung 2007)]MDQ0105718.1 threonine/homoserine/homoserine lactone efflux protein [Chitinophaga terrae (ex Kim and Jung 2007)]GEP89391.1 amino acid transporter [Chitinophaga terrae (ex Kim and Jung 2007)]SEA02905.1 Threonine/homoserine/homoserine lactone efflux protein [Chitinophaga terrae (ex Kim and Jung 2007)]
MVAAIVAGLGLGVFLSLSVGPVIFAIIKYSINNGFKAGISFALGVSLSDIMFVLTGNLATAFITGLEEYKKTIGICGGVLLIGMGIYGLIFKKVKISTGEEKPEMFRTHDYLKIWLAGFLMNTLNPGVIIFWLGVCVANAATSSGHRIVMYTICLSLVLSADILKVFVADKIRHKLTLNNVEWLNRIAGISMIIFGVVLLYKMLFDVALTH